LNIFLSTDFLLFDVKMMRVVGTASLLSFAAAQQAGTNDENYLMPVGLQSCWWNAQGQKECTTEQKSISLDANWRWTHVAGDYKNCYTDSEWDTSICTDGATCAQKCAAGAVNQETWEGTYGVKQNGNGVDVGFVTQGPYSVNVGSRSYMMENESEYKLFSMLEKEISFDVDLSNMPCGTNAAIYFSEMEKTGNAGDTNKAGAAYGTGYCDGQCARDLKWVGGKANSEGWTPNTADPYNNSGEGTMGACCAEMDLWEANMVATAFTPHPAEQPGLNICMGDEGCGRQDGDRFISPTDRDGCDLNAYRMGTKNFYGPGSEYQVNTLQPFKVVTRFHAPSGVLTGIEQFYVQNGVEIHHPSYSAMGGSNMETDESCAAQKLAFGDRNRFAEEGGMKTMGEALDRGMVLVISMWDDIAVSMNWLDSYMGDDSTAPGALRGPCDPADGKPETLREAHPDAGYTVTNFRWGAFGTTSGVDVVV
jgi:cellulose 1,4-beta-cellobiosidase